MSSAVENAERAPRFRTIDGLRGIAAMAVAVFHFQLSVARAAPHWLPDWITAVAEQGGLGVDVFFVISGFVIAFSVRDGKYTPRYLGLFALRRSIRLDPPYWLTIGIELALTAISLRLFPAISSQLPSVPEVLAHFVYLQDVLRLGQILPIFWTLCFEIQFYLMFVGMLVLWQPIKRRIPASSHRSVAAAFLGLVFAASLLARTHVSALPIHGLALQRWFEFFLGVLTWWWVAKQISIWPIVFADLAIVATVIGFHFDPSLLLAPVVSGFILGVASLGKLETVLSGRVLQFLGKISYSLYLLHGPIGERWISLVERSVGPSFGVGWAYVTFFSAIGVAIVAAYAMWRLVEVPTMRFSKRIRLESRRTESVAAPLVPLPSRP